jgi:hypothetical protein
VNPSELCIKDASGELMRTKAFRDQSAVTELLMLEIEIPEPSPRTHTKLFKLRAQQCRFVVSDEGMEAIFCGSQTHAGSSWCPWHGRLVYARPPLPSSNKQ